MTNNENDYEVCLRVENVHLPANAHFGVSAATGGLAGMDPFIVDLNKIVFKQIG